MKKLSLALCFALLLLIYSCASLSDQAKSRELLAKCKYDLKKVDLENIDFSNIITLANSAKDIDINKPDNIVDLAKDIKDLKFDLNHKRLELRTFIQVNNPNPHEVIMDKLYFDTFFDQAYLMRVDHDKHMVIAPNSTGTLELLFVVPTDMRLREIMKAENVVLDGRIWLKIEFIKGLPFTIPFDFKVKQRIPKEQIQAAIDKQKDKAKDQVLKNAGGDKLKNILGN
jgi:LEA14-like dessication related protein